MRIEGSIETWVPMYHIKQYGMLDNLSVRFTPLIASFLRVGFPSAWVLFMDTVGSSTLTSDKVNL